MRKDCGWDYISAIFNLMLERTTDNVIVEPHYIYRGITKRFFSRSKTIEAYLKEKSELSDALTDLEKRQKSENYYNERYTNMKTVWNYIEEKATNYQKISNKRSREAIEIQKQLRELLDDSALNVAEIDGTPINALKVLMGIKEFGLMCPEFIKSGLAVRLQNKKICNAPHIEYINYIKHMLNDIKSRFPQYEDENYSDLEILADIQHKGGASCLVDFSNNFLMSLWFATQGEFDDFGYLFCYDINKAMIESDKLSILDPHRYENKSIIDLLYETTKTTKYSGEQEYRFWLWKPTNVNERIARQDSIFIFGLEAFVVKEHNIITIPIPPTWKEPIQQTLKTYFGITAESVYCDVDGYAEANSKTMPYEKATLKYFNEQCDERDTINGNTLDSLQKGMDCLFQCEYELALKYFTLQEATLNDIPKKMEEIRDKPSGGLCYSKIKKLALAVELHFSKAICLKHIGDLFGAINEYNVVLELYEILNGIPEDIKNNRNEEELYHLRKYLNYFINKYQKAVNDLADMYYDTKQYDKVVPTFDKLNVVSNDLKNDICNKKFQALKVTVSNEIVCLKAMNAFISASQNKRMNTICDFDNGITINPYDIIVIEEEQPFYFALNKYFSCILEILKSNKEESISWKSELKDLIYRLHTVSFETDFYPKWEMKDLKELIKKFEKEDKSKYDDLMSITALIDDFANFVQGKIKIEPW